MGKILIALLLVALIGFGVWFYRLGGPGQLDLADRWWPGGDTGKQLVSTNIGYGSIDADFDNDRQSYDVYFPAGAGLPGSPEDCSGRKYPALIFFHGGSWRDGNRRNYGFVGRAFTARGYVTFIVDYRKAPQHRYPAFVADAARAIATIHRDLPKYPCADAERLFVSGHSAGAHIAMLAILDPQWLAANDSNASIVNGVIGLAGPYDFLPFTSDAAKDALGHWPKLEETQPIHFARGDAPPMLLLSGDADTTVKPRNSKVLAKAISEKGGKAEVKLYTGVDHTDIIMAVSRPFRSKAPVIEDMLAFMEKAGR